MRKSAIVFLIIIGFAIKVTAQSDNDNAIVIEKFDKSKFPHIKSLLLNNSYEFENFDAIACKFNTKSKSIGNSVYAKDLKVSLHGYIKNDDLILYAFYSDKGGQGIPETFSGKATFTRKQSVGKTLAFLEMKRVFKQLDQELTYRQIK